MPGHAAEDTYCHACGAVVIQRRGFAVAKARLANGACPDCGTAIPGRWPAAILPTTGRRTPMRLA